MKFMFALTAAVVLATTSMAGDLELGTLKAPVPKGWKEEAPSNNMRLTQFKLPKAEGDKDDADLIVFIFRSDSGSVDANLERQVKRFTPSEGKDKLDVKVDKIKIGTTDAPYQDIRGTYQFKAAPFDPKGKVEEKKDWRQLYVILKTDKADYYLQLNGPAKTVEKHKKDFDEMLKSLK